MGLSPLGTTVKMIMDRIRAARPNAKFPRDYLVFDIETTGFSKDRDLIVEIGHALVRDGDVVDKGSVILDWTSNPNVDQQALMDSLVRVKQQIEYDSGGNRTGKNYKFTYEMLRNEGANPIVALQAYYDWIVSLREKQYGFVTHNGITFDIPFTSVACNRWLGKPLQFGPAEVFDTAVAVKASKSNNVPWVNETIDEFFVRVGKTPLKGIKYALDTVCVPEYGLQEKYALDMTQAHTAAFDCLLTHLLFKHMLDVSGDDASAPF